MEQKKALVIYGGWDGHQPEATTALFIPFLEKNGFAVLKSNNLASYEDKELMSSLTLIVQCWTGGTIPAKALQGLHAAVDAGVGFAGWHGGIIDSFGNQTSYLFMTGGKWVAHPGNCVKSYRVKIVNPTHPIVKGIKDFELTNTEQYYILHDPGIEVLCETVFTGEYGSPEDRTHYKAGTVMPYAYTREYGKGRVFVAAWGHQTADFDVPEARTIVERGLLWAAKML
jgi:type 1 glutamine amidotransferase